MLSICSCMKNRHERNVVPGGDVAFSDLPAENLSVHLTPPHLVGDGLAGGAYVDVPLGKKVGGYTQDHEAVERNRHAERACREVGD